MILLLTETIIVKPNKKLMLNWQGELNNVKQNLRDLVLYEYVEKLFKSEETFNCLFKKFPIQDDSLLKVRRHLERYEKILLRKKLKEIRKLTKTFYIFNFVFHLGFPSRTFSIHRTVREGVGYLVNSSLPLSMVHKPLDVSRAITAESSPLHIASSQTRTESLWYM